MKTLIITCLAIAMMVSPAMAGEWFTWDETNTELFYYATGLMIVDLGQTLDIADKCGPKGNWQWKETNYFLGECPSRNEVKEYFATYAIASAFLTWVLPSNPEAEKETKEKEISHWYQMLVIVDEGYSVYNNLYLGIGIGYRFN